MEVLLEYETSRRLLKPSGGIVTRCLLEDEFENTGWRGSIDVRDAMSTHEMDEGEPSTCNTKYILQRWEHKWNCFIDVSNIEEVKNGDRLTVVFKPGKEQTGSPEVKVGTEYIIVYLTPYFYYRLSRRKSLLPKQLPCLIKSRKLQRWKRTL